MTYRETAEGIKVALQEGMSNHTPNRVFVFEDDAAIRRMMTPHFRSEYKTRCHVTKEARVVLTPRHQHRSKKKPFARLFAAVGMMLGLAFVAGTAIQ